MQTFNKNHHDNFIKYFDIKEKPWQTDMDFLNKTEKYLKFIKWIPGIRMVWVWNSISMFCSDKNSDIDLFIVTTKDSMWFNRIFITLVFQIIWVRKTSKKHAGRFCLSFFSTLDWLDFSSWNIDQDIYLYFWILYFKPILDYNDTYCLFIEKNSSWANFLEYKDIIEKNKTYIKYKKKTKSNKSPLIIWLGGFIDNFLKTLFLPKTLKSYNNLNNPYWIIINNDLLKFHDNDIRKQIKKELS